MGRILMVVRPSKGGAFGHTVRLSRALVTAGHEVAICGPHGSHRGEIDLELIDLEIDRSISLVRHSAATAHLAGIVRRFRPDLVHAHGSQGGAVARLARLLNPRTPVVFSPHNFAFTNWFTSTRVRRAYRAIERVLVPLTSRYIAVCGAELAEVRGIGAGRKGRLVYNGIVPFDPPEVTTTYGDGPVLTAVTELQPPKGVPTLVEAMPAILSDHAQARLLVAGDGPMKAEIGALIDRTGVAASISMLGQVPDVPALLGATDVFVAPGWAESFPYANLEAMSARLPIVAADSGGVGEAVLDGRTGRLVPTRDHRALASAVSDLLDDPAHARELGENARLMLEERFTLETMVAGTLAVYQELGFS